MLSCLAMGGGLSACGSDAEQLPAGNVLTASQLSKYPKGTVERAFFDFWSALQYQSWAEAAAYYAPSFRESIGTARIIDAKLQGASSFPLLEPKIVRVAEDDGLTTVFYTLRFADGTEEQASTTWRRSDGNWEMVYDSRLNPELVQLARNKVEIRENGVLATDPNQPVSPAATRAGELASRLQSRYLEEELKAGNP